MNEKFKKFNKILMATVAILLCLVLISTSVVSGVFARFVITKDATTTITFSKFGVKMQIKSGSTEISALDTNSVSVSVPITNMYPGDTKANMVLFAFSGKPVVPVEVTVRVNVTTHGDFFIESDNFTAFDTDTAFMPLQFVVGTVASTTATSYANALKTDAWLSAASTSALDTAIESAIAANIKTTMGTTDVSEVQNDSNGYYVTKTFAKNTNITFKTTSVYGIGFGFEWPIDGSTFAYDDLIDTYLVEQFSSTETPITVTFTVSIKQNGTA